LLVLEPVNRIAGIGWIKAQLMKELGPGQLCGAGHNMLLTCPHGIFLPATFPPDREGCAESISALGDLFDGSVPNTAA